jgi:hypothetical protein
MYGNILENMKLKSNCRKWAKVGIQEIKDNSWLKTLGFDLIIHNLLII